MLTDAEEVDAGNPDANQQKEAKGGKRGKASKEGKAVAAASAALRAAVKQARSVVKGAQAEARLAELSEQMLQLVAQPQPQSKSTAAPQNAKSDSQGGGKKSSGTQMGKVPAHSQTAALRSAQPFCGCCTRWFCLRSWCWPCSSALNSALLCAPLSLQDEFVILGVIVVTVVLWIVPSVAKKVIDCPAHFATVLLRDRLTCFPLVLSRSCLATSA